MRLAGSPLKWELWVPALGGKSKFLQLLVWAAHFRQWVCGSLGEDATREKKCVLATLIPVARMFLTLMALPFSQLLHYLLKQPWLIHKHFCSSCHSIIKKRGKGKHEGSLNLCLVTISSISLWLPSGGHFSALRCRIIFISKADETSTNSSSSLCGLFKHPTSQMTCPCHSCTCGMLHVSVITENLYLALPQVL